MHDIMHFGKTSNSELASVLNFCFQIKLHFVKIKNFTTKYE